MFFGEGRFFYAYLKIPVASGGTFLRAVKFEICHRDSYGYAGLACIAVWSVQVTTAAPKPLIGQVLVDCGANCFSGIEKKCLGVVACQIGAGMRGRQEKLGLGCRLFVLHVKRLAEGQSNCQRPRRVSMVEFCCRISRKLDRLISDTPNEARCGF